MGGSRLWMIALLATACTLAADSARAQAQKAPSEAELARLQEQIDTQRQVLVKLLQLQQQQLEMMLALMPEARLLPGGVIPPATSAARPAGKPREAAAAAMRPRADEVSEPPPPPPPRPLHSGIGTIAGRVHVRGGDGSPVYVYVADLVDPPARNITEQMKQQGKQFVPQVMVIPRGGKVDFTNNDPSFHNVFSLTPGSTFDLGSYHQGDSRSVAMTRPGVVSVYCNMHSQMYAHILVVPNSLYTKAGADGSYRIVNVPAGRHKVVAWTPFAVPATMDADVQGGETASLDLSVTRGKRTPHLNKEGLPYGSYKE